MYAKFAKKRRRLMDLNLRERLASSKLRRIPNRLSEENVKALIKRVTGSDAYADNFIIKSFKEDCPYDSYRMYQNDDKIVIEANTGVAACSAFNTYLGKYCNSFYGPITAHIELPDVPPPVDGVIESHSPFIYRYFFNYCTFSYTYLFAGWDIWERVTDYMLLSGINLYLNPIGHEIVWRDTLRELGYSQEGIDKFICGPAFLPWQWMGNMVGYGGNLSDSWYTRQKALSRKINEKMRAFSSEPMLPGYYGMVPTDFVERFPEAKPTDQGPWCGFYRPALLTQPDEYFNRVADIFYDKTFEHFGECNFFSADPFHEGGRIDEVDLAEYSKCAFAAMKRRNPNTMWFFQGWQQNPKREMIEALDIDDALIGNLSADETYQKGKSYFGYPWVYLSTPNFGGTRKVAGNLYGLMQEPLDVLDSPEKNDMIGVGMTMEAIELNEIFYDLFGRVTFASSRIEESDYIRDFVRVRYGCESENLIKATEILIDNIFMGKGGNMFGDKETSICARPDLKARYVTVWGSAEDPGYSMKSLCDMTSLLLLEYDRLKDNPSYRLDIMDIARQILSDTGWDYVKAMDAAYDAKDRDKFISLSKKFLELFDVQEELMSTNERTRLEHWIERARNYGETESEKNMFVFNARSLLTLWAPKDSSQWLRDYAHREWAGMIKPFYKKRWAAYLNTLEFYFDDRKNLPTIDWKEFDHVFSISDADYPVPICPDLGDAVRRAIASTFKG